MDDLIAKALHAARHHLAEGGFLDKLFSGPDYLSTGEVASPTEWGNPDVASDFFKADKALRLAREVQAREEPPMTAPRPGAVEVRDLPPPATAPIAYGPEPEKNPARAAIDEATKLTGRAPQGPELNARDRDLIIRTIAAETSGKSPEESQAIAHVILNRIQSGKYGASPEAVLLAKKQFEPWSNPALANYPMKFLPNSRRYGMGQAALEAALSGDDITGGALNFWGPKAQHALGRKAPGWAAEMPDYSDIGETRFHRPRADGGEVEGYGDGGIIKKALQAVGGAFKPTETGWVFKDVKNPNLTPAQNRAISHAIDAGRYVEAELPIRSMYATQPHVNADFATPVSSNRGNLPVVQRIGDEFYVRDGHHRLTKLATEGAETAKVNLVDPWERTPTEMPLLDWKPKTPEQMASERALAQRQKQENDDLYNDLMSLGFGDIEPQGRAHGGEVDDALRVVREHHADGEAVGTPPAFTYEDIPESVVRQAARQPAYDPAEGRWSDAGSTEGERLTRALGVEGELPKGETFMSAQPSGWDKYKPQRVPGTFLKRWGEAADENIQSMSEGWRDAKQGNYGAGALGMLGGALGAAISPLTGMERVLVRDPYLRITGNLKDAQAAEMVADAALTGGMRGPAKQLLGKKGMSQLAAEPLTSAHRLPSPVATGSATAAAATLAPEDAEAGNVDRILRGLRAYHGSPHKFDRFDLSKIGTGEGNQSYGHGLYFAENENVAKGYRDQLSGHHIGDVLIGNEKIPNWASRDVINAYKKMGYDNDTAVMASHFLREHKGDINAASGATWSNPNIPDSVAEALLRTEYATPKGHMYEVGIHADPERLLNWDKSVREQPKSVQEAVRYAFGPQPLDARIGSSTMDRPGPIHSRLLNEAGVPGIKYLDAGSRGITGSPTHNYVIFDDKLIDINRRYADGGLIEDRALEISRKG